MAMKPFGSARLVMLLFICIGLPGLANGGKVKDALFNLFGESKPKKADHHADKFKLDEEQAHLMQWLKETGYEKYATQEWMEKFDDELAYDSVEDFSHLVADEDYLELGIDKEEATKIQEYARKHIMSIFLKSVPLPPGAASDAFSKLLEKLVAAGYDEPDDVADIELDEAEGLGIAKEHYKTLVSYAEEYETRELLQLVLETYEPAEKGPNPFAPATVWKPLVEVLIKFGVRNLSDISNLSPMEGLSADHLVLLKGDSRVSAHATKQEL